MIINNYVPKNFGKEYFDIKGHNQYSMFLAVALGVKPSFDDWIDSRKYGKYVEACSRYGMVVEPDVIFTAPDKERNKLIGRENITTTYQEGRVFDKGGTEGDVHVFVSKTREQALEAKKFGWYSVVTGNRSINKPFVDHLRLGKSLGFPGCCIDFFREYNNWHLYSHPFETFKNTPIPKNKARGSYYCNNFLMDHTYFFIHHLPCSYRCRNTIELAKKVEEKIRGVEPDYAQKTVELLKKPLLVFGEQNFVIFNGDLDGSELRYSDCEYIKNPARIEESVGFFDSIKNGNKIRIDQDNLLIMKDEAVIKSINKKKEWFMVGFD